MRETSDQPPHARHAFLQLVSLRAAMFRLIQRWFCSAHRCNCRRVKDALAAEQPGEPPLRVALKTLLKDKEGGMGDESASSDDDDNSTVTSTSRSTRTESTAHGGDSPNKQSI